jgi:sugar phosphate isomerase/epimerase
MDPDLLCEGAAASGLSGIEWGVGAGQALALDATEHAVTALARSQESHDLACCSLAVHDEQALTAAPGTWERLAAAATALDAPYVRVYATPPSRPGRSPGRFQEEFDQLRDALARAAEVTARAGRRLLLEPAPSTLAPGPALAVLALSSADQEQVGVVYDPGSLAREGWLDPFLTTDVLGPLLRHVHAKNTAPRRTAEGRWAWERSDLTAGIVDWSRVFHALNVAQYEGWVVLDHLASHTQADLRSEAACLTELTERDYSPS